MSNVRAIRLLAIIVVVFSCTATDALCTASQTPSCCKIEQGTGDAPAKVFKAEGFGTFTKKLFDTSDFPARWYCGDWSTDVGWLHVASDFGIFSAYFAIPGVLLFFMMRRKDLPFPRAIWLFAAFILACGLGHLVEAGIFWWPVYRFSGLLKFVTAVISWTTVFVLIRLMPTALRLPSAALLTDKLLKSQERLDIALQAAQIGVWEIKLSDDSVICDARTREMFGFQDESECTTMDDFYKVIHPEDRQRVSNAIRKALENKTTATAEYRIVRKDGSIGYVQSHGKIVLSKASKTREQLPESLVGVTIDITDKQRKDAALLASEQNFRGTFDNAAIGIALLSLDGHWLRVNPGLCKILGYSHDELLATTSHLLTHPDDVGLDQEQMRGVMAGEFDSYCIEKRHIRKDGRSIWVKLTASVVRDVNGQPTHFVKVIEDIDTRKQTELELQQYHEQVEKLSLVASKTQHSVIITDAQGKIEWINEAFTRLTGYDLDFAIGRKPGDFLQGEETSAECIAMIRESLSRGESIATEIINYWRNGQPYWIELKIDPVYNDSGELTNFIGTQVDISERKQAEQSLQQAKVAAEAASLAKSEFLATMSHELRTPLNGVIGMTELLADSNLDARQQRFVGACKKSGQNLLSLINDILDFSKIEAGKLELDQHPFDLLQLLQDAAESMAYRIEEKGLQMQCSLRHPVTMCLSGDSHRLRQVLINLLGNAVKFTSEGLVRIDVAPLGRSEDHVDLMFRVKDTGIGIPEDRLQRLFKEFSQVDSSTNRRFGGTGLGLSISKNIVEAMNGSIGVKSIEGLGSEFWFQLALPKTPYVSSLLPVAPSQLKELRILVTEENQETRDFLDEILHAWGMQVDTCSDLRSIHSTAQNAEPYDAWIVDETLLKSAASIQDTRAGSQSLRNCRVFAMQPLDEIAPRNLEGIAGNIQKPIGPSALLNMLLESFCRVTDNQKLNLELLKSESVLGVSETSSQPLRILLAEDNVTNQLFAEEILARKGWHCEVVADGVEALKAVQQQSFDVVLMDCQMPEMDGFEATRQIRELEKLGNLSGHLPIIALTANAITGDRERCLEAGMDEYLSKPFAPKALTEIIGTVTSKENADSQRALEIQPELLPESTTLGPINEHVLLQERCTGDIEFAVSLLQSFKSNSLLRLDELVANAKLKDTAKVRAAAHSLKGIAGIVAAERLSDLAAEVETAGQEDDLATIMNSLDALSAEVDACRQFIETYKPSGFETA